MAQEEQKMQEDRLIRYGQCLINGEAILFMLVRQGTEEMYSPRAFDMVTVPVEDVLEVYIMIDGGVYKMNMVLYNGLKSKLHALRSIDVRLYNPVVPRNYLGEYEDDMDSPKDAEMVWVETMIELRLPVDMKKKIKETIGNDFGEATILRIQGVCGDAHYFDPARKAEYVKVMEKLRGIEAYDDECKAKARLKINELFVL